MVNFNCTFCKGVLNFKRGKYKESLDLFAGVKLEEMRMKVNVRFYYIMNYIELKAYESARAAIHAFKQYYKDNDEIPESYRSGIPEALKYLNEIIKCEEEGKKIDDFIYNEAHNGKRYYHAIYIRDKMEKLK